MVFRVSNVKPVGYVFLKLMFWALLTCLFKKMIKYKKMGNYNFEPEPRHRS